MEVDGCRLSFCGVIVLFLCFISFCFIKGVNCVLSELSFGLVYREFLAFRRFVFCFWFIFSWVVLEVFFVFSKFIWFR